MIKKIYIIVFCLLSLKLIGQQTENYTQYVFNQFAINPAVAGTADCPDIKTGGKLQWVGIADAPMTSFISVHKALKAGHRPKSWHGVGAYIVDDRIGMFSRTQFNLAYAYHLKLTNKYIASVGFFLGGRNQKFAGLHSSSDPLLANSSSFFVFPDISLGGLIYSEKTYVGLSAKQVLKRQNSGFGGKRVGENTKSIVQYYFSAGTRIKSKTYVYTYAPSVLIKYGANTPASVDMSLIVYGEQDNFGLGINVRAWSSIAGIVEFKLARKVWLGYAYDFPNNKLRNATYGSHEIVLKFDPCGKEKTDYGGVHCPVF